MLTVQHAAEACGFSILCAGDAQRAITGLFCCDLLSWAMSRVPADSAWVTVMGNLNAVAVASLTECACIILAESAAIDQPALTRAAQEGVTILRAERPAFETALAVQHLLDAAGQQR